MYFVFIVFGIMVIGGSFVYGNIWGDVNEYMIMVIVFVDMLINRVIKFFWGG